MTANAKILWDIIVERFRMANYAEVPNDDGTVTFTKGMPAYTASARLKSLPCGAVSINDRDAVKYMKLAGLTGKSFC